MQIVIDIPKEKYDVIKSKYNTFPAEMKEWGLEAIRNGTPLSKGHGSKTIRLAYYPECEFSKYIDGKVGDKK